MFFSFFLYLKQTGRAGVLVIWAVYFLSAGAAAQTPAPTAAPSPNPAGATGNSSAPPVDFNREPVFQNRKERPAPPLPSLARPGIQETQVFALGLNDAIRLALENNNDIEVARNDVRVAEGTLLSLQGVYDPLLGVTPRYTNSAAPQTSTVGGANETLRQTVYELNSSVTKQFAPGGGNYQFFFNNQRDASNSTVSSVNPYYTANFGLTFTQPLLRNFSIDRYRHDILVQKKRVAQSDADFRMRVIEIITQVEQAYWELVFTLRDQQNRVDNVNLAREQFRDVEGRVAVGTAAPLERTEVQTQLSAREAELITATTNVTVAENTFKSLILKNWLAPQWKAPIMPTDPPPFDLDPVNIEGALADAIQNRPELQRIALDQEINRIDLRYYRNQAKPRVDLVSSFSSAGLAGSPSTLGGGITQNSAATQPGTTTSGNLSSGQNSIISGNPNTNASAFLLQQINQLRAAQGLSAATVPVTTLPDDLNGGYGRSLGNLFSGKDHSIVVGLAIEIPFGNRTARGNLAVARAQTDRLQATLQQQQQIVETDVRNAVQRLESARQTVLATRTGRRSAELQVGGERQLYIEGRSTTFLVFQRENDLANARNAELRAEADYNTALAALQRATANTLKAVNISIDDVH